MRIGIDLYTGMRKGRSPAVEQPLNVTPPALDGPPVVGDFVTTDGGTWTPSGVPLLYQWQTSTASSGPWSNIAGATNDSIPVVAQYAGLYIRVSVTASNPAGTAIAYSVASAVLAPPINTVAPVLNTESAYVGTVLTVTNGTWSGNGTISYAYQWYEVYGATTTAIPGATSASYTCNAEDLHFFMRCVVTATDDIGSNSAQSNLTYSVQNPTLPSNAIMPVTNGTLVVGSTLTVSNGTWLGPPTPIVSARVWQMADDLDGPWVPAGSVTASLVLTNIHAGKHIRVVVTATNLAGSTPVNTVATPVVMSAFNWREIDMTAGTDTAQWVGYSDGGTDRPQPAFGSISAQPTAVTNLLALYDDMNSNVYLAVFAGDYVSQMETLALSISGIVLDPFEAELINGNTWLRYNGVGDLTDGAMYEVTFG